MELITGTVAMHHDVFLRVAKNDYNNYQSALIRELVQNSYDAGASIINIYTNDEKREIHIEDNGCGMTLDILINKLFCYGGTTKDIGKIGAFGKAKELIFFPWERYEIETLNNKVSGSGAQYSIESDRDFTLNGTNIILVLQKSEYYYIDERIKETLEKMEINCKIIFNDLLIECSHKKGILIEDMGWASIYLNKETKAGCYTRNRIRGLWMFDSYVSKGEEFGGEVTLEINGNSIEILVSNRDGFKCDYSSKFNEFMERLTVDTRSTLTSKNKTTKHYIKGEGKNFVFNYKLLEAIKLKDNNEETNKNIEEITKDLSVIDKERVMNFMETENFEEEMFKFLSYKPDFVIINTYEREKEIKQFMKKKKSDILAKMWTEIIKQIMIDNNMTSNFVCGFNFNEAEACYERLQGIDYFYVNPDKIFSDVPEMKNRWFTKRWVFAYELILKAAHEIAHMDYGYHSESYVNHFHKLILNTFIKGRSVYEHIQKIK